MKKSMIGSIYPLVLHKAIEKQLNQYYNLTQTKSILHKVRNEYKLIINRAPDLGGNKNIFISNIYLGAYVIAVYKNIRSEVSLKELDLMIANALNDLAFMKKKMSKADLLSPEYKEKLKQASLWCKKNKDKYPTNWLIEVIETGKEDELRFDFSRCGLCHLCKAEGVPELTPSLCKTDFITYEFAGCDLERTETLGDGNDRCNFLVKRKN